MRISENALHILCAMSYRGIGRAWIIKNYRSGDSPAQIVSLLNQSTKESQPITVEEFEAEVSRLSRKLERFRGILDGLVAIGDDDFPLCRGEVKNSERPVAIFYRGNLKLLGKQNQNIAVIGLLNPDTETEAFERVCIRTLVRHGATIVSGLALGCDSIAHKEALVSRGTTVAILPSPISEVLPQSNKALAEEIVHAGGLILSEYYEVANSKTQLSSRYLERDRLQALFSDCVLLAASYAKNDMGQDSGSRHAMEFARSYSITRAVVYDAKINSENPMYDLNRQLIKEDSEIYVLHRDNIQDAIPKLLSKGAHVVGDAGVQGDLFS